MKKIKESFAKFEKENPNEEDLNELDVIIR